MKFVYIQKSSNGRHQLIIYCIVQLYRELMHKYVYLWSKFTSNTHNITKLLGWRKIEIHNNIRLFIFHFFKVFAKTHDLMLVLYVVHYDLQIPEWNALVFENSFYVLKYCSISNIKLKINWNHTEIGNISFPFCNSNYPQKSTFLKLFFLQICILTFYSWKVKELKLLMVEKMEFQ